MSRQIIELHPAVVKKVIGKSKYPIADWVDGEVHVLRRGADFPAHLSAETIASYMYAVAGKLGLRCTAASSDAGATVAIRFYL